ncbi:NAD-dependent epimerase/dehydratase family protein [Mucilaginibacter agri]|uniref:NAD-dependent epimerase/dehydratase family protein n=1 Tax=Mucilaginibacter agri TaxID=2695265 RepID=A0A966DT14_9SPHI|nr:NAD-dependent epimerase/dehydratase family protein [Mucilaginibacter agri]NCD70763.1 NAD-dependent epimerase/dehydratase family protein [Mucilaginibacter agri]
MILLTGANGFLGSIIKSKLNNQPVITLGRSAKMDIICDLQTDKPVLPAINLVVHAAGKAHFVPRTQADKQDFFAVNVTGTQNLLNGLETALQLPQYIVFISSVAVYGVETGRLIAEDAPLLAEDPYGMSKIQAEKIVEDWCVKNGVICTILRLPLLAGANPPGNLRAMIKGIEKGYYFNIAGGKAKKSIVLAEDVAKMIPVIAKIGGTYNLTDRFHPSFYELSGKIAKQLLKAKPASIPLFAAKIIALLGDLIGDQAPINSRKLNKIISDLTFDDSKAVKTFEWNPTPVLDRFRIK